jgi:ABC-type cobalamin/Fe3+-siderophores transport system ATPase subunit
LSGLAERSIDSISDGERQRTLIARSLAQDTGLLVMDEPTAFLDLPSRYGIVSLLRRLTREKGKCVIYSTHDLDTAINEADRIWLMTGDGVTEGAPEDLMLTGSWPELSKARCSRSASLTGIQLRQGQTEHHCTGGKGKGGKAYGPGPRQVRLYNRS